MQETQTTRTGLTKSVKNGCWEVLLTDPSLNKFNFSKNLTDRYITTDIISPLGEKSILYNTISLGSKTKVIIELNFQEIDQTKISSISVKASDTFFENWQVVLQDNRSGIGKEVSTETMFAVEPAIELNKLMKMGFSEQEPERNKSYFELHLEKIESNS